MARNGSLQRSFKQNQSIRDRRMMRSVWSFVFYLYFVVVRFCFIICASFSCFYYPLLYFISFVIVFFVFIYSFLLSVLVVLYVLVVLSVVWDSIWWRYVDVSNQTSELWRVSPNPNSAIDSSRSPLFKNIWVCGLNPRQSQRKPMMKICDSYMNTCTII